MEIWEVRSRGRKKQFEYLLFEKMRLPNLRKARFCSQNYEIHGNLGGQEPGTKKQFEYLLFEKMRLPNLRKARFCRQNCEIHGNLEGQEPGTKTHANKIAKFLEIWEVRSRGRKTTIWISSVWKNATVPNLQKARFCRQNCEIHGNLGGQEPGTKKTIWRSSIWKNDPTSKKLDFAAKIAKFMEIWQVRSRGRKKQFEDLLFEKMRLPNLQKARFCSQNCEIHGNLGGQEPGTKKTIWISSIWKNAPAQPPKS